MRRLLSIMLFAATLLPLLAPLLTVGAAAQSTLPACCRREGKHHCMMGEVMTGDAAKDHRLQAPREVCPYQQRALPSVHHEQSMGTITRTTIVTRLHEPSALGQAECLWRISFDRSRQKRGPPSLLS